MLNNDVLDALKETPDLFALTADDAVTGAVSYVGGSHRSLIDHIIVSKDVSLGQISGDDAAIVRIDKSVRDFAEQVSDHIPIVMRVVSRQAPISVDPVSEDPSVTKIKVPDNAESVNVSFS